MDGEARRQKIMDILNERKTPVSGSKLAKQLGVSRQIIVGDIALLRASNSSIIATNNGYILGEREAVKSSIRIKVSHKVEDIFDELCTITDEGARVKDISIEHSVLGTFSANLSVSNRSEARAYTERTLESGARHPGELTKGVHYHTIEADDPLTLIRVQKALNEKGYLSK